MKVDNLVNKEKLLAIIEKIGRAPWEKGEGMEKLIPYDAVMLAIESPAQTVSPAELAEILPEIRQASLKGDSWVLEGLKKSLIYRANGKPYTDSELSNAGYNEAIGSVEATIEALESQAPVSKLDKQAEKDGVKADLWDKLIKDYTDLKRLKREINEVIDKNVDELLAQPEIPPEAKEEK